MYSEYNDIVDQYEYIFVPDDDIFMSPDDICKLFQTTKEYDLNLSQPAIIGYYSLPITLPWPYHTLRYTNFVEQMCPCFNIESFKKLSHTFNVSKSCWGIEILWNFNLGNPVDKIAIIDDVIAMHTRPIYCGDNYSNNKIENAYDDILKICKEYNLTNEKITYEYVYKEQDSCEKKQFIFPNTKKIIETCNRIRRLYPI